MTVTVVETTPIVTGPTGDIDAVAVARARWSA